MGKWVIFGPHINTFERFSKSDHLSFMKLYLMADIKKWLKVTVSVFFTGNSYYALNGVFLGAKPKFLNLFVRLF